ncbi:MAG: FAD-binding oxidoreductase [Acidobacteriota bacterium]
MPTIQFDNRAHELQPEESVLECLLRNGHIIPNSCRAGACQACLVRSTSGTPPTLSSQSLKSTLSSQGYFLSCICRPDIDLHVELAGAGVRVPAKVASIAALSHDVALVRIKAPTGFEYRAGQYVTLIRPDGLARSYSIASLPTSIEDTLDLHVRRIPRGAFSNWLHDEARPGDPIQLQGPAGSCFYADTPPEQPMLLAGTGTGLAPLFGILQDALRHGHSGPIWLFHGALTSQGLYLREELQALAEQHPNFRYVAAVLNHLSPEPNDNIQIGLLADVIAQAHPKLKGWRGFVCGDPGIVGTLKMKFFLAGMPSREIFADAFLLSASTA